MAEVVTTRAVIEQTKGMLMLVYDIDANRAFDYLVRRSQTTNVMLRTVAQELASEFRACGSGDLRAVCNDVLPIEQAGNR